MRWLYSFFLYLLSPYLLFRLWWKGRKLAAYRERVAERFCWDKQDIKHYDVWVHAVSLGEVIAATPLIEAILEKNWSLLITTMTPTGAAQVKTSFSTRVTHRYVPYDLPSVVKRFFYFMRPKVAVIIETELWPNLIAVAAKKDIPIVLANARLSARSLNGYLRLKFIFQPILNYFTLILAQSHDDAQRFVRLGAQAKKVLTLGNMKFDLQTNQIDKIKFEHIKEYWGSKRPVVIIASTHDDEESQILAQLKSLQHFIPNVLLLIAPRHPERFQSVYQLCTQLGFVTGLRSQVDTLKQEIEVVVLDCLGELLGFYHISDYAFIGGSFVPVGGHNVLEPIAMQVPVFTGQYIHNFKAICSELAKAQAIVFANDAKSLVDEIVQLYNNPTRREQLIENASRVLRKNKGSVEKHLQTLQRFCDK